MPTCRTSSVAPWRTSTCASAPSLAAAGRRRAGRSGFVRARGACPPPHFFLSCAAPPARRLLAGDQGVRADCWCRSDCPGRERHCAVLAPALAMHFVCVRKVDYALLEFYSMHRTRPSINIRTGIGLQRSLGVRWLGRTTFYTPDSGEAKQLHGRRILIIK